MHHCCPWLKIGLFAAAACGAAALVVGLLMAAPQEPPAPSSYAPANDLEAQMGEFVDDIESDLADESEFGPTQQGRIQRNAASLAAIALVLGKHDTENKYRQSAPQMVAAAEKLAAGSKDFAAAKAALEDFKKAMQATAGGELEWEPVGELQVHMQQVPILNNDLRRKVEGRRFDRYIDDSAALSATLAAIAQASSADTSYCADEEDEAKWRRLCGELRDSAAQVNAAVRKKDQEAAVAALDKVAMTCDACHHEFDVK